MFLVHVEKHDSFAVFVSLTGPLCNGRTDAFSSRVVLSVQGIDLYVYIFFNILLIEGFGDWQLRLSKKRLRRIVG